MRICPQCKSAMTEGFDIKSEGGYYGIKISRGTGVFAKRFEKPKVAICPRCGEISMYLEKLDQISADQDEGNHSGR
ncbi:MAG TPA: nucleic acid-binding protein [Clostridiaceae bacterium]|nr:nucleic acid-binding protein [Clostridiaceae bacterium]